MRSVNHYPLIYSQWILHKARLRSAIMPRTNVCLILLLGWVLIQKHFKLQSDTSNMSCQKLLLYSEWLDVWKESQTFTQSTSTGSQMKCRGSFPINLLLVSYIKERGHSMGTGRSEKGFWLCWLFFRCSMVWMESMAGNLDTDLNLQGMEDYIQSADKWD